MKSTATTVAAYLKGLPADRRTSLAAVRKVILKNLPRGYEEVMEWGMISYQVPLAVYPDTYNGRPLVYAGLASQKNHLAVYLSCVYGSAAIRGRLAAGFKAAGKRLDMGKSCIRFRSAGDLALDAIGAAIASLPMADYVAFARKIAARKP